MGPITEGPIHHARRGSLLLSPASLSDRREGQGEQRGEGQPGKQGGLKTRLLPRQPVAANRPNRSRRPSVTDGEGAEC
jgi:hypothetical protein